MQKETDEHFKEEEEEEEKQQYKCHDENKKINTLISTLTRSVASCVPAYSCLFVSFRYICM